MSELVTQRIFLKNMAPLWALDAPLAMRVDAIEDDEVPRVEPAKSGDPTLCRTTADGRKLYLHSKYNPVAEALKWAEQNAEDGKFCYFIEGMGLGHHIKALYEHVRGEVILVVIEPDVQMLRAALECVDVSEALRSRRLVFITSPRQDELHRKLDPYSSYLMMGTKIVSHHPTLQLSEKFFTELRPRLTDFVAYTKTAMVTLVINSQITCRNVLANLATYLATPPINELKLRFQGFPAIVVSAGPSLKKNIHELERAVGKSIIIATQTTFKPLLARGIIPDFVCSLDYHEVSKQYYEGVENFHNVHLVAEPKAHHSVIDAYGGPVSVLYNQFAHQVLGGGVSGARDGLPAGSSVAHLAFYLAEYMGCDPVVLIGQDLAFTDHLYYAPGMAIHEAWQSELNRFNTLETKEWERIMRNKPILRKVKDQSMRDIYTEDLMFNYLQVFERDFARTRVRVINATQGGALLRGTDPMALCEVIDTLCTRSVPENLFEYRNRSPWYDPARLQEGQSCLSRLLEELNIIKSLCAETLVILEELKGLVDRPSVFNRKIQEVDRLRLEVRQHEHAYGIVTTGAQMAEFRKFSADQKLGASTSKGAQRARAQLERDITFVSTLQEDTDKMIDNLNFSMERLEQKQRGM